MRYLLLHSPAWDPAGIRPILDAAQIEARATRLPRDLGVDERPTVFVLDSDRRLRYEGRFDDARLADRVTSHDVRNAIDDILADREVPVPKTRAFGCGLDLV